MAVSRGSIAAVGHRLEHDPDFRRFARIDLRGRTIIPGLVDAHTHFFWLAKSLAEVSLDGIDSLDKCLNKIKRFADSLPRGRWVVGNGLLPAGFRKPVEPDRIMLDRVTGGRPAFIFYKDSHSAWVNSKALSFTQIDSASPDPPGGRIERLPDGTPSGILREAPAYLELYRSIPPPPKREMDRFYRRALETAYRKGVTGVHSFDGPDGFTYLADLAEKEKTGVRINYYPPAAMLPQLEKTGTRYGIGTDFFRIAGVKVFADGALSSQSALCFHQYTGSKANFGIEVTPAAEITRTARRAARLGLPCAIHASMQPSHCPADIDLVRTFWGKQGANAYAFGSVLDKKIPLAFGSDAPIEALDPIAGIAAAVRRAKPGSRDVFHPEQRLYATEALHAYTVGPALAAGQEHCRGYLLPGYPADFVVLDRAITRIAPARIYHTRVLATVIAGKVRYCHSSLKW